MSNADEALGSLREFCLSLPETTESDSWGHPNFRAGKRTFAAFEWIKGRPAIVVRLGADEANAFLLGHSGSFAPPYGRDQWVGVWADETLDWSYLQDIVERGYRSVALKRMIAALEQQAASGCDEVVRRGP